MLHSRFLNLAVTCLFLTVSAPVMAQPPAARRGDAGPLPSIEEKTAGLKKLDGLFPLYWDERAGQLWMEIARLNTEFLHNTGYGAGLGSNDIGLDRGALGRLAHRQVRARGAEGADGGAQLPVPLGDEPGARGGPRRARTRSRAA